MLHYLLQVVVFQLIFLLVYEFLLKKETFFTYNRLYLLLTPVLALVLPMLKLEFLQYEMPRETFSVILPEVVIGEPIGAVSGSTAQQTNPVSLIYDYGLLLYGLGVFTSILLFLYKFRSLMKLKKLQVRSGSTSTKIVEVPGSKIACTFWSTIFIGEDLNEQERKQILSHELVHVRERHTLDLLYFELLRILFWFNPLVYIFQTRITELHEFIADAGVVESVEKKVYYQQLLNTAFGTENIPFVNLFFNQSIIKKRILMLQKSKSKRISKLKFLIILPLMLSMLTYVACSEEPGVNSDQEEISAREKLEEITLSASDSEISSQEKKRILDILDGESSGSSLSDEKEQTSLVVPFAVVEEVPVYPGCETLASNSDRKECLAAKITDLVNKNFDTSLGREHGLTGLNRIYVQFKINKEGVVEITGVRAPHPALKEEAKRVISLLPEMAPGQHDGKAVGVLYSLPISFKVGA